MGRRPDSPFQAWGSTVQLWASFPPSPKMMICSKSRALGGKWVFFKNGAFPMETGASLSFPSQAQSCCAPSVLAGRWSPGWRPQCHGAQDPGMKMGRGGMRPELTGVQKASLMHPHHTWDCLLGTPIPMRTERGRTHARTSCEHQDGQEGSSTQASPQQTR